MIHRGAWLLVSSLALLWVSPAGAQSGGLGFLNGNRPVMDAHNCYPDEGRWKDRVERALSTGYPVAIEQDLAWHGGRAVVSHEAKTTGAEPGLREYFFERVRPAMEKALAAGDRSRWPLIVLHFDFKNHEEPLLREVWKMLGQYEAWLTKARKTADPYKLEPMEPGPLLVLTEDSDADEKVFFDEVPVGGKMLIFGSAHTTPVKADTDGEKERLLVSMRPEELLVSRPTNYRRWWNSSWYAVEEGGQRRAGEWTTADERRLRALVDHAHRLGYWIRFYTLDGFAPDQDKGWTASYNFGSKAAVMARWKAAVKAGVNLIATDQYEELAAAMK